MEKYAEGKLLSFEEAIAIIDDEISRRKSRWHLDAVAWMDYDDVAQKLRLHIYKKWDKWDQCRPLRPWLNRVINNQINNMLKSNYSSFVRPCLKCPHSQGNDLCALYKKQCDDCPLYAKWAKTKKRAYDAKLPISIFDNTFGEDHQLIEEIENKEDNNLDFDELIPRMNKALKEILKPLEWKVYNYVYIENKTDQEAAKLMGYKTSESHRSPGYKQIRKIKNRIMKIAQEIVGDLSPSF
jgi:RNA polymerase sigma factor (sigma-70 family)